MQRKIFNWLLLVVTFTTKGESKRFNNHEVAGLQKLHEPSPRNQLHDHQRDSVPVIEDRFQFVVKDSWPFSYQLNQGNLTWLQSAFTFLVTDGYTYTTEDGSLIYNHTYRVSGWDNIGSWNSTCFVYVAGPRLFQICCKTWEGVPAVVFQQSFLNGSKLSAVNVDDVISSFPSFLVPEKESSLAYLQFQGSMFGQADTGLWKSSSVSKWKGGHEGGPISLFRQNGAVAIISPFNQFMSASRSVVRPGQVSWGVMGGVDTVPEGFQMETILFYGYLGLNQVWSEWGSFMRRFYNKDENYRERDITLNYLGYWTDGGAYYFYNTEPKKTYEQTILDINTYTNSINIPFRYVQYDSWFYPKDARGGVTSWIPASDVAPDGFQYIYNLTKWPSGAHNRWWSPQTPYAKANGGSFNFIIERNVAIPQDQNFWMYLFDQAKLWGLTMYEQDHLSQQFSEMNATQSTVHVADSWLIHMARAARAHGLTVQYCMAYPRYALHTLLTPAVTQARVSGDYRAGSTQWQIGVNSIMANALGIAPFKDNFWTTEIQPGNPYNLSEPHGELQAAVATLSRGPVAPSDMIGHTNRSLLMQCCRSDGKILGPAKPAMAIDKQIWQSVWGGRTGPEGELWTTFTLLGPWTFGIILAPQIDTPYYLTPTDAGFEFFSPTVAIWRAGYIPGMGAQAPYLSNFTDGQPLVFNVTCSPTNFCMCYTSPVFKVGDSEVVIYGEEDKFVPMSADRIFNIDWLTDSLSLVLKGVAGESTVFSFFVDGELRRVPCTFGKSGKAVLGYDSTNCTAAY